MNKTFYQPDLFPQLPAPTEARVQAVLCPIYPLLWETIHGPWEDILQYRSFDRNFSCFTEEEVAQTLTTIASHRARALLTGCNDVRLIEPFGKLIIVVGEEIAVTIKKLTKRTMPDGSKRLTRSNYLTGTNQNYWDQRRDGDFPDMPRVILGYQLLGKCQLIPNRKVRAC